MFTTNTFYTDKDNNQEMQKTMIFPPRAKTVISSLFTTTGVKYLTPPLISSKIKNRILNSPQENPEKSPKYGVFGGKRGHLGGFRGEEIKLLVFLKNSIASWGAILTGGEGF